MNRRGVWSTAAVYAAGAWIAVEATTRIAEITAAPPWTEYLVMGLFVLGFPIVMLAAWRRGKDQAGLQETGTDHMNPDSESNGTNTGQLGGFFSELRRRHVFGSAAIYAGAAWVIVEASTKIIQISEAPGWIEYLVVALFIAGFPVAMYLAWAFDFRRDKGFIRDSGAAFVKTPLTLGLSVLMLLGGAYVMYELIRPVSVFDWPCVERETPYQASIGVLPFSFVSLDPADAVPENVADGFSEDIRITLAKVPGFCVSARLGSDAPPKLLDNPVTIAKHLNVRYLVNGKVTTSGEDLLVSVSLMDSRTGFQKWSDSYSVRRTDLLQTQRDISRRVVGEIAPPVLRDLEKMIAAERDMHSDAYYHFLLGRHYFYQYEMESNDRAIELFQQSTAIDDRNPIVLAALAKAYDHMLQYIGRQYWGDRPERALAALERALELNPNLAPVQTARGKLADLIYDDPQQIRDARIEAYRQALQLEPNNAEALDWLSQVTYDDEESMRLVRRALRLDPYNATIVANYASMLGDSCRGLPEAIALLEENSLVMPKAAPIYTTLTRFYAYSGRYVDSINAGLKSVELDVNPWRIMWLVINFMRIGDYESAELWLDHVDELEGYSSIRPSLSFFIYRATGRTHEYLERVLRERPENDLYVGWALLYTGNSIEAIPRLRNAWDDPNFRNELYRLWLASDLAYAYRQTGREEEAVEVLEKIAGDIDQAMADDYIWPQYMYGMAMILAQLGRHDDALALIKQTGVCGRDISGDGSPQLAYPLLKQDARIKALLQKYEQQSREEQRLWSSMRPTKIPNSVLQAIEER